MASLEIVLLRARPQLGLQREVCAKRISRLFVAWRFDGGWDRVHVDHVALVPCHRPRLIRSLIRAAIIRGLVPARRMLLEVAAVCHLVQAALHVLAGDASDLVSLRVEVVGHLDFALSSIVVDLVLWHAMARRNHCALVGGGMLVGPSRGRESLSCSRITRVVLTLEL